MKTITKEEYTEAKRVVYEYETIQKELSKFKGYSKCPFCGGTKTKPFIRQGKSQDCFNCNKDGLISNRVLADLDLNEFIDKT